jgi:hypothetical protein
VGDKEDSFEKPRLGREKDSLCHRYRAAHEDGQRQRVRERPTIANSSSISSPQANPPPADPDTE